MSLFVRAFTRQNIAAIAVGVLVAGTPLVAFNFWLSGVIDRQGQAETDSSAQRAVALADARIDQVVSALNRLAAVKVDSCEPAHLEAMQRAAFATAPIKEISIVSPEGNALCGYRNGSFGQRRILSSEPLTTTGIFTLDVVQIADGQRMIQLRRAAGFGPNELSALVPAILLLPQISRQGDPVERYARIETREGAAIGEIGRQPADRSGDLFVAAGKSDPYGFTVEVMTPRSHIMPGHDALKWIGLFMAGVIMVIAGRFWHDDAQATRRQSGCRTRARARGRRVRALLPADRRHPLRSVARRRSTGALA